MATRQKPRNTGDVHGFPEPTTDAAEPAALEIPHVAVFSPTVEALEPSVGDWVQYQVQPGRLLPMLVTAVYDAGVDGVIFSAAYRDVRNSYGTLPVRQIKRGDHPGQWQAN